MTVNRIRMDLDCDADQTLGLTCADQGMVIEYEGDGTISTNCPSGWSTPGGNTPISSTNEIVFTAGTPFNMPIPNSNFCQLSFNVKVLSVEPASGPPADGTPTKVEVIAGFKPDASGLGAASDAFCPGNGLPTTQGQTGQIPDCPSCPNSDNDLCTPEMCNVVSGMCETGPRTVCPNSDNDLCTPETCNAATGLCETGARTTCPNSDNDLCTAETCNAATGLCETGARKTCPNSDNDLCTPETCNAATGLCETGARTVCSNPTCQTCNSSSGNCELILPPPPECVGCRITGGGIACDPSRNPQCVAEILKATFGGQVGAPCGCIGCFDDFDHVQGAWTHNRKQAQGSFHAKDYNSLICGCDGDFTNGLCNPGNRPPGPEPRPAPANMACFSGIGDYALTGGRRTLTVAFRVEVEDRSEPGGTNGTPPPDVYRIRIWIPNPTAGETANALAAGACCTNATPTGQAARAPNVDDGGSVIRGNIQIHPQTPNSADGTCPVPSGRCTPSP